MTVGALALLAITFTRCTIAMSEIESDTNLPMDLAADEVKQKAHERTQQKLRNKSQRKSITKECDVDSCFDRCENKYEKSIDNIHGNAYYCAKGCAEMKKGRVKDKDKFCKIKLQEDRRFLGYIDCQQASRIQRHKDACRFGCEFWSIKSETLKEIMQKLAKLTEEVKQLKACCSSNAALAEENRKRHENVDVSLRFLCPLIDEIYDVARPPGGVRYDCCYESYKGVPGQIGNALMCVLDAFIQVSPNPPFPHSPTGFCANTCGGLPREF